jgi:hypothetical protein
VATKALKLFLQWRSARAKSCQKALQWKWQTDVDQPQVKQVGRQRQKALPINANQQESSVGTTDAESCMLQAQLGEHDDTTRV